MKSAVRRRRRGARWRADQGQTFTEYLMILGFLTAMIISLSSVIVPTIREVVATLITQMSCGLTSVERCP
jgi:Flp pilus assembly pilin Flp